MKEQNTKETKVRIKHPRRIIGLTLVLMLAGSILTPAIAHASEYYIFDFESYGYARTEYKLKPKNDYVQLWLDSPWSIIDFYAWVGGSHNDSPFTSPADCSDGHYYAFGAGYYTYADMYNLVHVNGYEYACVEADWNGGEIAHYGFWEPNSERYW